MGSASSAARLFSLHAPWCRVFAQPGRLRRMDHRSGGRLFSPSRAAAAQRAAVLSGSASDSGGAVPGSARADSSAVRFPRPRAELYTGIYMRCHQALLILWASAAMALASDFSGTAALEYTRKAVSFGPRPPGSAATLKLQEYIQAKLKTLKCTVSVDAYTASTPVGPVPMKNIIAKFPGRPGKSV